MCFPGEIPNHPSSGVYTGDGSGYYGTEEEVHAPPVHSPGDPAVPLAWKEVYFRYEQLPPAREYPASLLIGVVLSYDLDTIRVTSDSTTLRFGNPRLCEFFRRFKPSSLERRLIRSPLDTSRSPFDNDRSDTERRIRRSIERANRYRLYFADTSRQAAIEALSAIPGVISVRRPAESEIFQDREF